MAAGRKASGKAEKAQDRETEGSVPAQPVAGRHPASPGVDSGGSKTRRPRPRGGRQEATAAILDAAAQLFAERGPRDVTVRDIAAAAGVSHALVHRYLGSKEEILGAVLLEFDRRIVKSAEGADTLREAAVAMLRANRYGEPRHLRLVANAAMASVPFERLGIAFPATRRLVELAEHEQVTAGGQPTATRGDVSARFLVAGLIALAVGWMTIDEWLLKATGLDELDDDAIEDALERLVICTIDAMLPSVRGGKDDDQRPHS